MMPRPVAASTISAARKPSIAHRPFWSCTDAAQIFEAKVQSCREPPAAAIGSRLNSEVLARLALPNQGGAQQYTHEKQCKAGLQNLRELDDASRTSMARVNHETLS